MARRVADLSKHVTCKLKSAMKNCSYFSVALDEIVDVTDVSQVMIFARWWMKVLKCRKNC